MQNPSITYQRDILNPFTEELKHLCETNGKCLVRLVSGEIVYIENNIVANESETYDDYKIGDFVGFKATPERYCYQWGLNGKSWTSSSMSILEIVN